MPICKLSKGDFRVVDEVSAWYSLKLFVEISAVVVSSVVNILVVVLLIEDVKDVVCGNETAVFGFGIDVGSAHTSSGDKSLICD